MIRLLKSYVVELWQSSIAGWNQFWFTPEDPATLACIRIATGWMLFYTHLVWTLGLTKFLGPQGMLDPEFVRSAHATSTGNAVFGWSHFFWTESTTALWCLHAVALVVFLLLMVGAWTRVTSVLACLFTISYNHRAFGSLFGLDQLNVLLSLYVAVGASGAAAAYSVDAWWTRRHEARQGRAGEERVVSTRIAIRLIQLHMCIIYLFAGIGKLLGGPWWDGTAMWNAFANYEYQTVDMTWLGQWPLTINAITLIVVAWEISYIALVWPRLTRPIMIALAIPLHMGIAVCMGMITFGSIMLVGNFAFVSPWIIRSILAPQPMTNDQ